MTSNEHKAYQFFSKYPGHLKTATSDIADRLNISEQEVTKGRRVYREDNSNDNKTKTVSNASEGVTERIESAKAHQSYEEFLEHHGLTEDDVTNVWFKEKASGTYFSVEARKYKDAEPDFDPREAFIESIKEYTPKDYSHLFSQSSLQKERIAFLNLFDAHIDKICSTDVTDSEASIEKNIEEFEEAFDELLRDVANKDPELIVIPFGNDFFQTNDFTLSTKKGTPQWDKVHVTGHQAFRIGVNLIRRCVDKARAVAPVLLIPVRGNHDEDRVRYMLECLLIAYENQEDVEVEDTRKARIYIRYGYWLFGLAHGDKGIKVKEYPDLMMTDKDGKKHWSEIGQGVYFLGHVHHEKRYEFLKGKDFRGCKVEVLRGFSPMDEWHWEEGWTAIPRTAYAFVYDKDGTREHELKVSI